MWGRGNQQLNGKHSLLNAAKPQLIAITSVIEYNSVDVVDVV